jgi:hypothetical protein
MSVFDWIKGDSTVGKSAANAILMPRVVRDAPGGASDQEVISNFNMGGNKNFANQAANFAGGLAAINPVGAAIRLGNNLGNIGSPVDLARNPGRTLGAVADYGVNRFTGIPSVGVINKVAKSPIQKLLAYSTLRGAENVGSLQAGSLMNTGGLNLDPRENALSFGTGAALNALASPLLTIKATKSLVKGVGQSAQNVVDQPKLQGVISKLNAPVDQIANRTGKGTYSATKDAGIFERTYTESGFNRALRSDEGLSKSIQADVGLLNEPKVKVTFDSKGNVVSWTPERPEFGEYVSSASMGAPVAPPKGVTSKYERLKGSPIREGEKMSLARAQFRSKSEEVIDANRYIKELTAAQEKAHGSPSMRERISKVVSNAKSQLVDKTAPIEDLLYRSQKQGRYEILPKDNVSYQIDRVLRSGDIAGQFAKDKGLATVIQKAPNTKALDQYLIARHAAALEKNGIRTGRDPIKDAQLVRQLAPQYEALAKTTSAYSRELLDYAAGNGLISKELAATLKAKYPDYVPVNRIFSEGEEGVMRQTGGGRGIASQSSQSVVQRIKGSEREIESPLESLLAKTNDVFQQGERNKAAQQLIAYKDLPGNPFGLREIEKGENTLGKSTVSAMIDGKKVTYETLPEIATAAKNLDAQQLGLLGKILTAPVRALRLGATGLNPSFVLANFSRDQVTAFINANRALETSILNPTNFLKAMWGSLGHGELYQQLVRQGAHGTSFDIGRDAVKSTIGSIRSGRNLGSKIAYTVTNPSELLRATENIIGRTEDLTRIQVYKGTYDSLIKEGRTAQDAAILAANEARNATTNFARSGSWGKVLNSTIPYLNAGIQGSRTLVRGLAQRPAQTTAKIVATVLFPTATIAAWNLSDPDRKKAYDDIQDYEKKGNLIIVPPNPTQDDQGRWNVIKIPLTQEAAGLADLTRRGMEAAHGGNPVSFNEVAGELVHTGSSLDVSTGRSLVSQLTPQAVKPWIESQTNQNLFTGNPIIPDSQKDLPPDLQVGAHTSGTARVVGGALNTSPRIVENFIGTSTGGLGRVAVNAVDQGLAAAGVIPENQIGGQDLADSVTARFNKARGGVEADKAFEATAAFRNKVSSQSSRNTQGVVDALRSGDEESLRMALSIIDPSSRSSALSSARERLNREGLSGPALALSYLSPSQIEEFVQSNPQYANAASTLSSAFTGGAGTTPSSSFKSSGVGKGGKIATGKRSSGGKRKIRVGGSKSSSVSPVSKPKSIKPLTIRNAGVKLGKPRNTKVPTIKLARGVKGSRGRASTRRGVRRRV